MIPNKLKTEVRQLLAHCFHNPVRQAARAARTQFIMEMVAATSRGEDVDREATDWLQRLRDLVGPHAQIEDVTRWYALEEQRLRKLADGGGSLQPESAASQARLHSVGRTEARKHCLV